VCDELVALLATGFMALKLAEGGRILKFQKRQEKQRAARLRSLERQLAEMRALRGDGVSKADGLLAQARDAGLTSTQGQTWEATIDALRKVGSTPLASIDSSLPDGGEFARLSSERASLLDEQRQLRDEIARARDFVHEESGFSREATEQQARLKSIGIFDNAAPGTNCPLCEQSLEVEFSRKLSSAH
jgi:hypothetical protein